MPATSDSGFWHQYVLVLDARTLAPKRFTPLSPQWDACPSTDAIRSALGPWTSPDAKVIAILVNGVQCGGDPDDRWAPIAQSRWPSAYVFTPTPTPDLGIRSGWYSEATPGDSAPAEISGFFQKSWPVGKTAASDEYRFVPGNYVSFDTNKAGSPAGQNTMVVGDKAYTSGLPSGGDGFQVLVLDKTLKPMLGTPTAFANGAPVGDMGMAKLLEQARTTPGVSTVFVQSIGTPTPPAGSEPAWTAAGVQLDNLGGNLDVFLSLGDRGGARPPDTTGWYSFVAAPDPGCLPPAQAPPTKCYSRIEASTPLTQKSGDLSGVLGRNQTWQYAPLIDEPGGDEHTGEMLTLAYRPPSKWPYSDPGSRRVLHYLATYNQGATDLSALGDSACYDPGPLRDVRSSYCNIEIKGGGWAGLHTGLGDSKIDQGGKGAWGVCAAYPGEDVVAVDATQYARVCDQISRETFWLSVVQDDMLETRSEIGTDRTLTAFLTVQDLSNGVQSSVQAGGRTARRAVSAEGLELAAQSVELVSLFLPPPTQEAGELFGAVFSLGGEVTSLIEGDEQGESAVAERIELPPDQVAKLGADIEQRASAAGASFSHAWDLLVSDPEKLNAAYENFALDPTTPGCDQPGKTCGIWKKVPDQLGNSEPMVKNAVRHWAAGKFMAATYDVWTLGSKQGSLFTPGCDWRYDLKGCRRDVAPADVPGIKCIINPGSLYAKDWKPFSGVSPDAAYYRRDQLGLTVWDEGVHPRRGSSMLLLAQSPNVFDQNATSYYPPQSLLTQLYRPVDDGGYGWERPWLYNMGQGFLWHPTSDSRPQSLPYSNSLQCEW